MIDLLRQRLSRPRIAARRPGAALTRSMRVNSVVQSFARAAAPWLSVVLLVAIIVGSLSLFIWFLLFTDTFVVQAVTILDAREHTAIAARTIIEQRLASVPFDRNILLVPTDLIESHVQHALPQVRTVHITRQLPGTIKVIIQEKSPSLLLLSRGQYYFVDSSGAAYEEARLETLPGIVLPTVKNRDPDATVTVGVPVVAESFVSFVQQVGKELPDLLSFQVAEIQIPSLAAKEVYFILDNNWELRFDVTRDSSQQLATLRRVVNEIITPEERQTLEYIDLRIADRVYYKATATAVANPK